MHAHFNLKFRFILQGQDDLYKGESGSFSVDKLLSATNVLIYYMLGLFENNSSQKLYLNLKSKSN